MFIAKAVGVGLLEMTDRLCADVVVGLRDGGTRRQPGDCIKTGAVDGRHHSYLNHRGKEGRTWIK